MFIDRAKFFCKAGSGGDGCNSHYTDMWRRYPMRDGGDGGRGGDIILRADENVLDLLNFRFNKHFLSGKGGNGSGKGKTGANGKDLIIPVPAGTIVRETRFNVELCELVKAGQEYVVCRGGKPGVGNKRLRIATKGQPGDEKELQLELKIVAQVGIIGFPNAGKSSMMRCISNAKPKVDSYPFTTKFPVLGVTSHKGQIFTVCDIPGLIEGAHKGKGLGIEFLRHVERTRVLLHVIDMAGVDGRDPIDDFHKLNHELKSYNVDLSARPQILAANKMDLPGSSERLKKFRSKIKQTIYPVSALKGKGINNILTAVGKKLKASA